MSMDKSKKFSEPWQKMTYYSISDNDFKSSNDGNDIECKINVFDIRYEKNLESAQPIKVKFEFSYSLAYMNTF